MLTIKWHIVVLSDSLLGILDTHVDNSSCPK